MLTDVSFADYRAMDGLNWSTIRAMDKSPAHYKHRLDHPRADTPRLLLGRAVHAAVLEPDSFPTRFVVYEGKTRRGKEWEAFKEANADKGILKRDEYAQCLAIRDAVRDNDKAAALLDGTSEVVARWTDADTEQACKGRIDHVCGATDTFVDLKTTSSVDEWAFAQTSGRMLYHGQAAFYARGIGALAENPYIIAVEDKPPHDVAVFQFADAAMLAGDQLVTRLMKRIKHHTDADTWPGRYDHVLDLQVPEWMVDPDGDAGMGITIGGEKA